jgi:hypothetical protein
MTLSLISCSAIHHKRKASSAVTRLLANFIDVVGFHHLEQQDPCISNLLVDINFAWTSAYSLTSTSGEESATPPGSLFWSFTPWPEPPKHPHSGEEEEEVQEDALDIQAKQLQAQSSASIREEGKKRAVSALKSMLQSFGVKRNREEDEELDDSKVVMFQHHYDMIKTMIWVSPMWSIGPCITHRLMTCEGDDKDH